MSIPKDVTNKRPAIASAPAPAPAPVVSTVSGPHDINNKNNNVSSGSNKPPGCGWDTVKGKGWATGTGKLGRPPTISNITTIRHPELRKKWFGEYEHLYINLSKFLPWMNYNETKTKHSFNAIEEQSRNVLHSHINVSKHDNETVDADNSYANSNECSSECSSKCSYNYSRENK